MVGKLMKHEWRRTRGAILIGTAIAVGIGLIAIAASLISGAVMSFPFLIGVLVASTLPFAAQLYLAIHLYQTTYGRRGYFEHSIPVKGSTLLLTKFVYAVLASLYSVFLSVVVVWLLHLAEGNVGTSFISDFATTWDMLGEWSPWGQPLVIIGLLLTVIAYLAHFYFSVTVGSESWLNKLGAMGPVITFVIVYLALQFVAFIGLFVPPAYSLQSQSWEWGIPFLGMTKDGEAAALPAMAIVLTYVASAVLLWRAVVSVSKKLELR